MKGLIIKPKWADYILDGYKTIELRGSNTKIRGQIGIIESGTGLLYGTVELTDCKELSEEEFYKTESKHLFEAGFERIPYKKLYGWILKNPVRFKNPIRYNHKQGCVIWVNIDDEVISNGRN